MREKKGSERWSFLTAKIGVSLSLIRKPIDVSVDMKRTQKIKEAYNKTLQAE